MLRMLGYPPLAAIKTHLTRTKFNRERSTDPRPLTEMAAVFIILAAFKFGEDDTDVLLGADPSP
ncbi:hypothetical protein GCM10007082_32630 [Oceanisphaera arctica]|nr:hypothetical protein GCM10007082_32630 [Oceanisphaera arctica]